MLNQKVPSAGIASDYKKRNYMSRQSSYIAVMFIFILIGVSSVSAIEPTPRGFAYSHFIGIRFGAWTLTGDKTVTGEDFSPVELSNATLYTEFFYAHRIKPPVSAEITLGVFSQGDIEYLVDLQSYITAVKIYSMMISAKLHPLPAGSNFPFKPYLRLGGGLVYGSREAIDNNYSYNDYFIEDNEAKLTYVVGAGLDWPVADQVGLNLDFKITPAKFGKPLAGFKDYSGWQLALGIGYIFQPK